MTDTLSPAERSELMRRVRSRGNRSTELRAAEQLIASGISGWVNHPDEVPGTPDFYFPEPVRLALFVDGCFWHGCACKSLPKTRTDFWRDKIEGNRRRDERTRRKLRRLGFRTMRVWEHDLRQDRWIQRLQRRL